MRVIFVNRFYWPEETATAQLLCDLAEGLVRRGRSVTVIARRPAGAPRREIRQGVHIERIRGTRWDAGGSVGLKLIDFASFYLGAFCRLLRCSGPGDAVVALTDPPLIGIGAGLAARWRRARCYHWVQDIYPEIAIALSGRRELGWLRPMRDRAWRRAQGCVTLGRDMAAVLAASGVPAAHIHVIANWAPAGLAPSTEAEALRRRWGLEGKFVAAYSGNLGRVHDLEAVLDVAAAAVDQKDIVFLFVGDGPGRPALEREAKQRGLDQVLFRPSEPRASLAAALSAADVHLVALKPGCEAYVFPSKVYGAAAVGRPVLFLGPPGSEIERLIRAAGIGYAFSREQAAKGARALAELSRNRRLWGEMAGRSRTFAAAAPLASAIESWDRLLEDGPALSPSR